MSSWGENSSLGNNLSCWGGCMSPLYPMTQLGVTYSQNCVFQLIAKDVQLWHYLPFYLMIPFIFLLCIYIFQEALTTVDFHMTLEIAPSVSCSLLYSLIYPLFSFSTFNSSAPISSHSSFSNYSFSPFLDIPPSTVPCYITDICS